MRSQRQTPIILLFRPEPAGSGNRERDAAPPSIRPEVRLGPVSVKALVWMVISVLTSLAIGQLH